MFVPSIVRAGRIYPGQSTGRDHISRTALRRRQDDPSLPTPMSRRACIGARRLPRRSSDVKEPYDVLDREIFAVVAISTCSVFAGNGPGHDRYRHGRRPHTLEWLLYIAYKNGTPAAETHSGQTQGFAWDQPGHLRSASSWNHYHKPSRANELAPVTADLPV